MLENMLCPEKSSELALELSVSLQIARNNVTKCNVMKNDID
jgi:hypothetical protein